ncbi:MAG: YihA family ribosome biogenesis GTP-binding protein [Alphaproteobacteria bacterium]|nr:YihA family ribosome biogenesis GTP-binding protein [Alphaproteobacteria bacterium]MCB9696360.1 YihA family ribosome biogenesis GTP-binding protein [Alphaproteobacteria bacterium]
MRGVGQVEFLGSFPESPPETGLPEVAFAGRSNVGKSSALNTLLSRKQLARVSHTPGRTQLVNLFRVEGAGEERGRDVVFADLPGYGFAKVPEAVRAAWKPMIEGYLGDREALKLVVVLVDVRRDPQEMDGGLLFALTEAGIPSLVVATKVDKLSKQQAQKQLAALRREFRLPPDQPIGFSSVTKAGREDVWARIDAAIAPEG